jgi:hypothetical protein
MKIVSKNTVVISMAFAAALLSSQASAVDVRGHYKVGADFGGDTLVTVMFTNGESDKIKSNDGLYIGGGISLVSDDKKIETEISLSYKVNEITASNGDVTWSRWPLDVLAFYRWSAVRLGGGVTYHFNPELDGSGVISGINVDFKNSLGFALQGDWRINEKMNLGLRYTLLDYEAKTGGGKVDANGLGIVFSGSF